MSYSALAARNTEPKWLECFLARDDDTVPYTLSEDELANVLYRLLKFGEFDVIKVDLSAMKSIKVKVRPEVNIDNHRTSANMVIREGLYLQAMKEVKQEKVVKLSWLPSDVTDQQIVEVMEMFGKVTKQPVDSKFIIKDSANEITKRLRNVFNNDKIVEVLVERNIPSYIKIADKKVKVWYRGQQFSCARCFRTVKKCPGSSRGNAFLFRSR